MLAGTHALLLRRIVKGVARKHGFGGHVHGQAFYQYCRQWACTSMPVFMIVQGMNIFADADPVDPPRLMPRLRHAVGGSGGVTG